jgi:hypothetical protein
MKFILPAAALLLSSTTAFAQLAPQDVLERWRGFYAGFGATIATNAPELDGSTTRYPNVLTQMSVAGTEARYSFDWIDMESLPDGAVNITFSPTGYATTFAQTNGSTIESRISYDLGALTIHAEGTPDNILFSYDAAIITAHQSQTMPEVDISITTAIEGMQGEIRSQLGADDLVSETGTLGIASLTAKLTFVPSSGPQTFVNFNTEDLAVTYDLNLPSKPAPEAPIPMFFPENLVFGYAITAGTGTTTVNQKSEGGDGRFTLTHAGGELTMAFAANALSYGFTATQAELALANTPPQPVDFSAAFARLHFGLTLPLRKSDTPSPFALALALQGFTVGDDIWDKLDPEATLSRAPASFAFALNGTAKLFVDLFDQTALTALRGAPFELRALSLSSLSLDFEGMGLTGNGDVTFNNERIDPMSGLPEPLGALDFSINGALGMLDKIGRLGFGDPMMIIGAKAALGMFATPNSGPDSFTSRIEFTDGGHISVNGQQVK